jgi:hypothetical protein
MGRRGDLDLVKIKRILSKMGIDSADRNKSLYRVCGRHKEITINN